MKRIGFIIPGQFLQKASQMALFSVKQEVLPLPLPFSLAWQFGRVEVESVSGQGATFRACLPYQDNGMEP